MALVNKLQFELGRSNKETIESEEERQKRLEEETESREEKQKRLREEENQRRKDALDDYRSQREIKYEYDLKLLERNFELQKESDERKYELELKILEKTHKYEMELAEFKAFH